MIVFTCENDFEAIMTCIYHAWEWAIKNGHDNMRLEREPILQGTLFDEYIHIEADSIKAEKVVRAIRNKISDESYIRVYYACLAEEDLLDSIYRYLRIGFRVGEKVNHMLTEDSVMRLLEAWRKVGNESHFFREFMRFSSIDGKVYIAHFEPKCNVAHLVSKHFEDRMPSEHWMIIDDVRKIAVIHPKEEEVYIRRLTDDEFEQLKHSEECEDEYTTLWKSFFEHIAIKERTNYKCQRNLMPLWMRKHVVEFKE